MLIETSKSDLSLALDTVDNELIKFIQDSIQSLGISIGNVSNVYFTGANCRYFNFSPLLLKVFDEYELFLFLEK